MSKSWKERYFIQMSADDYRPIAQQQSDLLSDRAHIAHKMFAHIDHLEVELVERKKQVDVAFEILEEYTPTDKLQEANDKMILLVKGITEEIGRALLKKRPLKNKS